MGTSKDVFHRLVMTMVMLSVWYTILVMYRLDEHVVHNSSTNDSTSIIETETEKVIEVQEKATSRKCMSQDAQQNFVGEYVKQLQLEWNERSKNIRDVSNLPPSIFQDGINNDVDQNKDIQSKARAEILSALSINQEDVAACTHWIVTVPSNDVLVRSNASTVEGWCSIIVYAEEKDTQFDAEKRNLHMSINTPLDHISTSFDAFQKVLLQEKDKSQISCRRNFGYAIALALGAESILDLDEKFLVDDDKITLSIAKRSSLSLTTSSVIIQGNSRFNPYQILLDDSNHYPNNTTSLETITHEADHIDKTRGFPSLLMNETEQAYSHGKLGFEKNFSFSPQFQDKSSVSSNIYHIGVTQHVYSSNVLCPRNHKDIQQGIGTEQNDDCGKSIIVPSHCFVPYDWHSTSHMPSAFWALLLPIDRRISSYADIARSYIAQALFPDIGIRVQFESKYLQRPYTVLVDDHCDEESLRKEVQMNIYVNELINFLEGWDCPLSTIQSRLEHLWMDLYVRHFLSTEDFILMQNWLKTLREVGYRFPELKKRKYRNVAVMGHFNYAKSPTQVDDVIFWVQKYKEWFSRVIVTGPFSDHHISELALHSIEAHSGDYNDEGGYFQVTENLKNMLLEMKNSTGIDSLMYFHDDGILNVTELTQGQFPFPTKEIIGNYRDQRWDTSYADMRTINDTEITNKFSYRIYPNATACSFDNKVCGPDVKSLYRKVPLYPWGMTNKGYCGPNQMKLAQDKAMVTYQEKDGSILFSTFTQSDFLHVPLIYADEFAKLAALFLKHEVIHECAWGTIIDMIRQKYNANVRVTMLCTSWGPKRRGRKALIERCLRDKVSYGVLHPYKIGMKENGYKGYDWAMDIVQ